MLKDLGSGLLLNLISLDEIIVKESLVRCQGSLVLLTLILVLKELHLMLV